MVGKITKQYKEFKESIGYGGFGVYKLSNKLVIKEEHKVCNFYVMYYDIVIHHYSSIH